MPKRSKNLLDSVSSLDDPLSSASLMANGTSISSSMAKNIVFAKIIKNSCPKMFLSRSTTSTRSKNSVLWFIFVCYVSLRDRCVSSSNCAILFKKVLFSIILRFNLDFPRFLVENLKRSTKVQFVLFTIAVELSPLFDFFNNVYIVFATHKFFHRRTNLEF